MVTLHSPISEFFDPTRKKICLLDDNIFGYGKCIDVFTELQKTGKPFYYNQGLDIRLLTEKKAKVLSESKYDGDYIFAFDNYEERVIIEEKIKLFKQYLPKIVPKFYIFCAFDKNGVYDEEFWIKDIVEIFERLKILMQYKCLSYIMVFEKWKQSPYLDLYQAIRSWCNTPANFKKKSFNQSSKENKHLLNFKRKYSFIVKKYFDLKYGEIN